MRVFCTRCGTPMEIGGPLDVQVTCVRCGNQFVPAVPAQKKVSGGAVALVVIAVVVAGFFGIGTLAAIAIPNFVRFQMRSKQAECKRQLSVLYVAQQAYYEKNQRFASSLAELGWQPEPGNRYAYFLSSEGSLFDRRQAATAGEDDTGAAVDLVKWPQARPIEAADLPDRFGGGVALGLIGMCPDCELTMACAANLDGDETLDIWSISTAEREEGGQQIRRGSPYNDVNDVTD